MTEAEILRRVQLAVGGAPGVRVFRNQVGNGAAGTVIGRPGDGLLLVRGRPVTMGLCRGSNDLIGWRSVTVTPEMVGKPIAQFVAIEVKTPAGRVDPEQANFLSVVERAGGVAVVMRDAADAAKVTEVGR
jgi:hypothetical protein